MNRLKKYGFFGSIKLLFSLIYTKILFPKARLIRLPFDIRYKRNIQIGHNFTTGRFCRLEAISDNENYEKLLIIGSNVQINDLVHISAAKKIIIGNNVLIASKVYISDVSHGEYNGYNSSSPFEIPNDRTLFSKDVIIEDNVWIGDGVCILPGVTIGFGTIIGANSVVSKSIPSLSIAVGIPAKVIKIFNINSKEWELHD
jgi:acetyltransferase-like isoleucine patch superfamily enzyme